MSVPEGWHINIVGDLFDVQLGKMLNKDAKKKHPQVPYLTNFNVRWGAFDLRQLNTMYFSERDKEKFSLKYGDLIMCEGGEVGRCAIWKDQMQPCFYQKALHRLRPKKDILPDYFQSYMSYIAGTKLLDDLTGKTSIAHLTKEKLVELPVRVPPFSEQKKIVRILSTWDRAIEVAERLLNNSQQQKKALMQQLLTGKKRLPGFSGEWKEYRLEEIFTFKKGKELSKAAVSNKGKNKCILYGELYTHYPEVIKNVISFTDSHDGTKSVAGDVLIPSSTTTSGIDLANATTIMEDDVLLGGDINILRPNIALVNSSFIAHLLTHIKKHDIAKRAQGITIIHLYGNDLKHLTVSLPELKAQEKISKILADTTHEIEILEQKLGCLRQEKKALMQQLLTGKRRVVP